MTDWLLNTVLIEIAPKLVGALIAFGLAHTQALQKLGVSVDWNTLGGKLTIGITMLIGMLAGHHTTKAVQGGSQ